MAISRLASSNTYVTVSRFSSTKNRRFPASKKTEEKWYKKLKKTKKWFEILSEVEPPEKWYEKRLKTEAPSGFYTEA